MSPHCRRFTPAFPKNVETPRFRGNPGWGRLRGGGILSIFVDGMGRAARGEGGTIPSVVDRCHRSGDAPIGGPPRNGASLHFGGADDGLGCGDESVIRSLVVGM